MAAAHVTAPWLALGRLTAAASVLLRAMVSCLEPWSAHPELRVSAEWLTELDRQSRRGRDVF